MLLKKISVSKISKASDSVSWIDFLLCDTHPWIVPSSFTSNLVSAQVLVNCSNWLNLFVKNDLGKIEVFQSTKLQFKTTSTNIFSLLIK